MGRGRGRGRGRSDGSGRGRRYRHGRLGVVDLTRLGVERAALLDGDRALHSLRCYCY